MRDMQTGVTKTEPRNQVLSLGLFLNENGGQRAEELLMLQEGKVGWVVLRVVGFDHIDTGAS